MIIYKYRKWCTSCQEWQISDEKNMDVCGTCGQAYGDYKLRDIPQAKKDEQRERFKRQRSQEFKQVLNIFSFVNPLVGDVRIGVKVIESDAGLRAIEKAERDEFERLKQWNRAEREKYRNVKRNETCLCGSGKKYKNCCLKGIKNLRP